MPKQSKYSLLIICEGENTEPQFFKSIRDRIIDGKYPVEDMEITIRPEPKDENKTNTEESELKPTRKPRALLPGRKAVEPEIKGQPPLKWVVAGQEELRDGTFNEVWIVFDNDNHPAKVEAFEKAKEAIDGKTVNIAYSSISFEYFLLLHFEKIYKSFEKTECREGKKHINCSSGNHEKDCNGDRCIGGYARRNGYWTESKADKSLFPLIEDKLETGFWNAVWLRNMSDQHEGETIFYDRNPYITTDYIVKRLTGFKDRRFEYLAPSQELTFKEIFLNLDADFNLNITNVGAITIIIPDNYIQQKSLTTGDSKYIGQRKILRPGESSNICIIDGINDKEGYKYYFAYRDLYVCFD